MKKWLALTLLLAVLAALAYVSVDTWFIDEEAPESFTIQQPPEPEPVDCTSDAPCAMEDYEYIEWAPYCVVEDTWDGPTYTCYDYEGGEELCAIAEGPYYDWEGYPYFETAWEYCDVVYWDDGDDFIVPFTDITISEEVKGTLSTSAMVPLTAKVGFAAFSGSRAGKKKRERKQ